MEEGLVRRRKGGWMGVGCGVGAVGVGWGVMEPAPGEFGMWVLGLGVKGHRRACVCTLVIADQGWDCRVDVCGFGAEAEGPQGALQ